MPDTFIKIASVTVGAGGTSAIEFSSIPSTYTDLCVKASVRDSNTQVYGVLYFYVNGVGGTAYSYKELYGNGSSTYSRGQTGVDRAYLYDINGNSATSNTFGNLEIYIPNYASSSAYKSISFDGVAENNGTAGYNSLAAGLYSQNTAISTVTLQADSTIFQYSTATLYGIKNS